MRTITVVCAAALLTVAAYADQKTGYQIGGCPWYRLVDGKVIQVCERDVHQDAAEIGADGGSDSPSE